jgi:DNA protecting protein DprA
VPVPGDPKHWPVTQVVASQLGLPGKRERNFELVGVLPPRPRLAIVGSRAAHRAVLQALIPCVTAAVERGWSLVSGGALGIDGGAHRAALACSMAQLVVLPCSRDCLYPPRHADLFAAIAATPNSGLLFAHPLGTPPARAMFASRNAIVVSLADAVLVAEAGLRSGSVGTGRLALRRELPVAAFAGSPGCGALIGAGARPLPAPPHDDDADGLARVVESVSLWLDVLGGDADSSTMPESIWPEHLGWLATALREAGPNGLSIDALANASAATLALCEAELLGLVCEAAPGRWVCV